MTALDSSMMMRIIFLALALLQPICQGFDFTFHSKASTISNGCAELQCTEILDDSQQDHHDHSRKITHLTIYRRSHGAGTQWKLLTSVSTGAPRDHRVSDGRRISGDLTELQANITVSLIKPADCVNTEFSCVVVLVDGNSRNTVIRSFVGGSGGSGLDASVEEGPDKAINFQSLSEAAGQPTTIGEIKQQMVLLQKKLECIEDRLGVSSKDDIRLDDKIDNLKTAVTDKIHNLESIVHSQIGLSSNRIEDRLDRLENRLEDKVWQMSVGKSQGTIGKNSQNEINTQLELILESVQSTQTNISDVAQSCSSPTSMANVNSTLTNMVSAVNSLTATTNKLVTRVDSPAPVCAAQASPSGEEFFDVLGTGKREWRLAFKGTAYNNVKIYPAYVHGTGVPIEVEAGCKQFNHSLPCVNHYRNRDALENWANVDEVLLAVFNKGQVVKHIVFNGHGSTFTSWFEASRVILSSWDDLKTQSHNIFSIEGDTRPQYMRRFLINHDYPTCERFRGWFYAGEGLDGGCACDKTIARPFFQYAKGSTMAVWESQDVARADTFGVFVKYE